MIYPRREPTAEELAEFRRFEAKQAADVAERQRAAAREYERFRLTIADDVMARTAAAPRMGDLQRAMGMARETCTGDDGPATRAHAETLLGRPLDETAAVEVLDARPSRRTRQRRAAP